MRESFSLVPILVLLHRGWTGPRRAARGLVPTIQFPEGPPSSRGPGQDLQLRDEDGDEDGDDSRTRIPTISYNNFQVDHHRPSPRRAARDLVPRIPLSRIILLPRIHDIVVEEPLQSQRPVTLQRVILTWQRVKSPWDSPQPAATPKDKKSVSQAHPGKKTLRPRPTSRAVPGNFIAVKTPSMGSPLLDCHHNTALDNTIPVIIFPVILISIIATRDAMRASGC